MPKEKVEREVVLMPTPLPKSKTVVLQISPNNDVVLKPKANYWCRSICWICCFSLTFVICYVLACVSVSLAAGGILYFKFMGEAVKFADDIKKINEKNSE